jgi:hypothetical protein
MTLGSDKGLKSFQKNIVEIIQRENAGDHLGGLNDVFSKEKKGMKLNYM